MLAPLCPDCGHTGERAIVCGLPARICDRHPALWVWSFWPVDLLIPFLPFDGTIVVYSGSYWRALWRWARGPR